ncbi:MAG: hypothetical protein EZS28_016889 [Streblomastix strix]|uniref:Uncharacterized protein n=1 Tax=Streblomastix strix TaxID=222440 RepID=A0A5J4VY51_9EUKA|nr:MAG: hypothetical protein EZS28_016889 [Streblomastix strix]
MLKSKGKDQSKAALEALSKLIRNLQKTAQTLIRNGFIQMATFALMEEGTPEHVQTNLLIIILDLIINGADVSVMGGLFTVLEKFSQEKDVKKQEITMKAKMIVALLAGQGITGLSSQNEIQQLKREIDEYKKKNSEFELKDQEEKKENDKLKRKIIDLEHQLEESKSKPGDIPISINVPSGNYTKKEQEYTYTSTSEFSDFGVMKAGLSIPFGSRSYEQPYGKDSMFFYCGYVYQNTKFTLGNQAFKDNDTAVIEINLLSVPRTSHLFINGVQQPAYISGIPESVQYFFLFQSQGASITVLSLKRLSTPTIVNMSNTKEVKWE